MDTKPHFSKEDVVSLFINYFTGRGHTYVKPHSLIPPDDTILFTNSGMCQFKGIFLGEEEASIKYACNLQRCIRAGGKHNDFNDVGYDTYHHTMFGMLGNWSFNCDPDSPYKSDAIDHAWNLLVNVYKLDPSRMYVTYFGGSGGIEDDAETRDLWSKHLDQNRILPFGQKDNFWEMAETGPCGPCTEIHYDLVGGRDCTDLVNKGDPTVIELWNLVFIQYNRKQGGDLERLQYCSIDTGFGCERALMAVQNKTSSYDTDAFQPLFGIINRITKVPYSSSKGTEVAYRIIADHLRTIIYAILDDIPPSDTGRGYIITKLFKRACHYLYMYLNAPQGTLIRIVKGFIDHFMEADSEIANRRNTIHYILSSEEAKYGGIIWKSVIIFRKLLGKEEKIITKQEYELMAKTKNIYPDLIEQFCIDNKFTISAT
jgi:alanyl-tRNA synthetase